MAIPIVPPTLPSTSQEAVSLSTSVHSKLLVWSQLDLGSRGWRGGMGSHWGWEEVGGGLESLGPLFHRPQTHGPKQCSSFY